MNELDLLNSNELDESFYNSVDAGEIGGLVGSIAQIASVGVKNKATRGDMESKTSCVKPKMWAGRKKKQAYEQCLTDFTEASKKKLEESKASRTEQLKSMVFNKQVEKELEVEGNKILGMPKTVFYVGLGVLVLVGGFIGYKVIKAKLKK